MAAFDPIAGDISALGYNVLWRVPDHYNHMHIDIGAPGPASSRVGDSDLRSLRSR